MRGALAPERRAAYALAGDATLTVLNPRTSTRFTYRIQQADCRCVMNGTSDKTCAVCRGTGRAPRYFVKVLTGPENSSDYSYIGMIDGGAFRLTQKSKFAADVPSVAAFAWLSRNWEDARVDVWHEGACGRCGRRLTVPESIESGIGPVCASRSA